MTNWNIADPEIPTTSRPTRVYQGTPRLQENGTYLCDSDTYTLISYMVKQDEDGWACTCPDFLNRSHVCKHIRATLQLRADEKPRTLPTLESLFEEPAPRRERVKEAW